MLKATLGSVAITTLLPSFVLVTEVPGMLGDPKANELWYQLDQRTIYTPAPETVAAFAALGEFFGQRRYLEPFRDAWFAMVKEPDYPDNFRQFVTPIRAPLATLSTLQLDLFDSFYARDARGLFDAFTWFAEGVLYDPRHADTEPVHTMSGNPPTEYHTWWVHLRAMMLLGIDTQRWAALAPMVGYAWAVQSIVKPSSVEPNPGLPPLVTADQAARWLPKTIKQLDQDFQSVPYPAGT